MGFLRILYEIKRADKMSPEKRMHLQRRRLEALVSYARQNSPYFKLLYQDIPKDFKLTDLQPTNKLDMLKNFDEWVTDKSVFLQRVNDYMKNKDNIGRKMDGKYMINTTSGSTGYPSVVIYDKQMQQVMDCIGAMRTFARKEDMKAYIKAGGKSMGLYATDGFYVGCGSIRRKLLMMPWKKQQLGVEDVRKPIQDIVDSLNEFQPALLGGYPTALELLATEQLSGNLHISPKIINTGGEYLSENTRKVLSDTFGCYVQTNYACTEGGTIANECTAHHFHVNDDWVIVEPVDENNQPVPYGKQSAKILITNLANYIQPIIRFEITDRVIMHEGACPCGKNGTWLELEGRTDDILTFSNGKRIAPLGLYAILKEIHEIQRFQLVQVERDVLALRLIAENREAAFAKAKEALEYYLKQENIEAEICLSKGIPVVDRHSGKFKHVIAMK